MHLLDLADHAVLVRARGGLEYRPDLMEWQPWPIVLIPTVDPQDASLTVEVALLTDRVPERGLQVRGIDDGHVPAAGRRGKRHVQLARPVAPLAADGMALEDRRPIAVDRARDRIDPVRVAVQASRHDRAVEVEVRLFIAGREVPPSLLGIPGDRGLEEKAIVFDQVGECLPPGADHEPDFGLVASDDSARGVPSRLPMPEAAVGVLHGVLEPLGLEQGSIAPRDVRGWNRRGDRGQGAPHRVQAIGSSDLRVAADTGSIPHILHLGAGVPVG
jgi:hypothetical protein